MAETIARTVTFRVRRFEPGKDRAPRWDDHRIEVLPGMTVLDGLWKVKELAAPSLAWRSSCRMGICGSCGMLINGRPRLACNTQIAELNSDGRGGRAAAQLRHRQGPRPRPRPDVRDAPRAAAVPPPRRHGGAGRPDPGVLAVAPRAGAVPPVQLLHQVRLLHGGLPDGGHRPAVRRADAAGPGAPLQQRHAGRRVRGAARRCSPAGAGRGAATSPASARRSAPRAWTRPRRSSS